MAGDSSRRSNVVKLQKFSVSLDEESAALVKARADRDKISFALALRRFVLEGIKAEKTGLV